LGNNHSDDDEFVIVCYNECPSAPDNLLVPLEDFDLKGLNLESDSVEE